MQERGGYRENSGRKPGIPNKLTTEVRALLAPLDQPALARLRTLMDSPDDTVAFKVVELILSYRFGKPKTAVEIEPKRPTLTVEALEELQLSDAELRRLAGIEDGRSY